MAFKGTKRRSALEIAEVIEDVGGYINAYTSREATAYYARVLEADVPLALDVVSDIVRARLEAFFKFKIKCLLALKLTLITMFYYLLSQSRVETQS